MSNDLSENLIQELIELRSIREPLQKERYVSSLECVLPTGDNSGWYCDSLSDGEERWTHKVEGIIFNPNGPSVIALNSKFELHGLLYTNHLGKTHRDKKAASIHFKRPVCIEILKNFDSSIINDCVDGKIPFENIKDLINNIDFVAFYINGLLHRHEGAARIGWIGPEISLCYSLEGKEYPNKELFERAKTAQEIKKRLKAI